MQKLRHATREAGPLRVEINSSNPAVLKTLIKWKSRQYRRTGVVDVLRFDWTVALLNRVLSAQGESFSGMMSVLSIGEATAAIVLSMRSYDVLHSWFSAYDPQYARLSPGLIFWLELAKACPAHRHPPNRSRQGA